MNNKSIGIEIKKINNLIHRRLLSYSEEVTNIKLTPIQMMIMKYLHKNENNKVNQSDIEKYVQIRKSTLSEILNTMQKNNLIIRINSETDGRSKEIKLSNTGLEISNKLENSKKVFDEILSRGISEEELKIFFKVTDKIKENLEGEIV